MTAGKFTSSDPIFSSTGIAKLRTPDVPMSEEMTVQGHCDGLNGDGLPSAGPYSGGLGSFMVKMKDS